ncbi:MAG: YkgJ family cysteine cluster protein, partial [Desulfovibrionales bacterium]|nr:YkgJ family cysteine cluster protein [Desulfovibrionales bacterium]
MKKKLSVLEQLYGLHDKALADLGMGDLFCEKGCAQCCTCNVTLTRLEAFYIKEGLGEDRFRVLERLAQGAPEPRYRPQLSMNAFVRACMEGEDAPDGENDPSWGSCPLLEDGICTIYPLRPLGCRSLVSRKNCAETGYADMDPLVLTLNNLFIQFVEHLDRDGRTGNFSDMLMAVLDGEENGLTLEGKGFAPNGPIPV